MLSGTSPVAPERIRQEWDLFQEEVRAEAERLHQQSDPSESWSTQPPVDASDASLQDRIDRLRAQVADLDNRLEDHT